MTNFRGLTVNFQKTPDQIERFENLGNQLLLSMKLTGWTPPNEELGQFVYFILSSLGVSDDVFRSGPYVNEAKVGSEFTIDVLKEFDDRIVDATSPKFLNDLKLKFNDMYLTWLEVAKDSAEDSVAETVDVMFEEMEDSFGPKFE